MEFLTSSGDAYTTCSESQSDVFYSLEFRRRLTYINVVKNL